MLTLKNFTKIENLEKDLTLKPESYWLKKGNRKVMKLFRLMSQRVPAYKDFLKINKIDPDKIKSIKDLKYVPPVDKNNYLRKYPLHDLCWDGEFSNNRWVISTTSGSTGEPYYFPRERYQDEQYSITAELYLRNNFNIENKSTLYINGFAMGAWIGGVFTYQAIRYIIEKGNYQLSIITPGIFKREIIKAIQNLGSKFDQIIIGGYPPMIKDTIDDAIDQGLDWSKYNVGFIFSAEGFTESFRDYVIKKTNIRNIYTSTLNHYGSVDLGTMAHETPISILIRRFLVSKPKLYEKVFNNIFHLPTITQYNPNIFYFEEENENLLCSSFSGIPLIRYDLKDHGGVYTFAEIKAKLKANGIDLAKIINGVDLGKGIWNLPFVYVYERSDFIVKLYGANIYPETVRKSLQENELVSSITGKFTMQIQFDKSHTQYLEVNVELKQSIKETRKLKKNIQKIVVNYLLRENSEYRSNYKESPRRQTPKILLWTYEHPHFFRPGVKQQWVKK